MVIINVPTINVFRNRKMYATLFTSSENEGRKALFVCVSV